MKKKGLIFGVITIIIIIVIIIIVKIWDYNRTLDSTVGGGIVLASGFNSPIEAYQGPMVLGSSLRSLVGTLTNLAEEYTERKEGYIAEYLPTVELVDINITIASCSEESEEETYISSLKDIRSNIINCHYYSVEMNYSELGFVNEIIITY